ncbi:hypothetical protein [Allobaculum fili]|uniref:hypothetical protein n=1 Tax=Allobaculum fili TaxID=2834460 RepID=UPI001E4239F6|nr:hypothetical protein [Allobaculum fili]
MRRQLSGNDRSLIFQLLAVIGLCILTILGVQYIGDHGRSAGYYLTGNVISAGEKNFCITVIPDESNVELPLSKNVYCFELKDFISNSYIPKIGDAVRITCSHDMTVLIDIYDMDVIDDLPD